MSTINFPINESDAAVTAGMRKAAAPRKGKYMGTGARAPFDAQKLAVPRAADVRMEPDTVAGVPGWWCLPRAARDDTGLIYYHGGWYMLGTAEAFCNQASHFAALTRSNTFIPEYRRSPEAPFPAAYDDALAVYLDLAGRETGRIALLGDSVGGGLALLVLAAASLNGGPKPAGAVAMSPVTDLTLSGESMQTRADADLFFSREMVAQFVDAYLVGADPRDPRASPLFGDLGALPPIRIDVGDQEILLDDARRYAQMVEAAGVDVTLAIWAGLPHAFPGMIGQLDASRRAIGAETDFLNRVLSNA